MTNDQHNGVLKDIESKVASGTSLLPEEGTFLLCYADTLRSQWMTERNQWVRLLIRIAKPLGCLASTFPDGNEHVVKAAESKTA